MRLVGLALLGGCVFEHPNTDQDKGEVSTDESDPPEDSEPPDDTDEPSDVPVEEICDQDPPELIAVADTATWTPDDAKLAFRVDACVEQDAWNDRLVFGVYRPSRDRWWCAFMWEPSSSDHTDRCPQCEFSFDVSYTYVGDLGTDWCVPLGLGAGSYAAGGAGWGIERIGGTDYMVYGYYGTYGGLYWATLKSYPGYSDVQVEVDRFPDHYDIHFLLQTALYAY